MEHAGKESARCDRQLETLVAPHQALGTTGMLIFSADLVCLHFTRKRLVTGAHIQLHPYHHCAVGGRTNLADGTSRE
jgi:hypothetical protein